MNKYIEILSKSARISLVYRMNIISRTIGDITFIILWISVWNGLFHSNTEMNGYSFNDILIYTLSTQFLISVTNSAAPMWRIDSSIRSGAIGGELIKPYSYFGKCFFEDLGNVLVYMAMSGIPVFVLSMFIMKSFPNVSIITAFLFIISAILGLLIKYLVEFTIGLSSFWIIENRLQPLISFSISLFSGASIPLWFFPNWLKKIAELLPFRNIYFFPSSIITGKLTLLNIFEGISNQIFWLAMLIFVYKITWGRAVKKLEIQGG